MDWIRLQHGHYWQLRKLHNDLRSEWMDSDVGCLINRPNRLHMGHTRLCDFEHSNDAYEPRQARNRLFNAWINEHDAGHLVGCGPIVIMDVFEHAYMLDYGVKKAGYIEAFFKQLNWDVVTARLP